MNGKRWTSAGITLNPDEFFASVVPDKRAKIIMVQNRIGATGYNVVAVPLAARVLASLGIFLTPARGGILMSVSTIIFALNTRLINPDQI